MKPYLLGIDLGTSACKAAVFDREGRVIKSATGAYPVYYPQEGYAEQNPEEWWRGVCDALHKIFADGEVKGSQIAGIGVDGQSWSAVPIDKNGNVLANTPIWMDTRAQSICDRLNNEIGADKIFEVAGNSLKPSYTTPKILWYKENLPDVYKNIDKILQCNSFIGFKLTGKATQELSQGYGLHCFNMREGRWDYDMCRALGVEESFLPEIYACDDIIGEVTKKAAEETGLEAGTPVVAGGLDAACGTLGAGVLYPGETQEQGGQAGGMSICIDEYKADERLILSYHVIPGKWLLQGGTVGGGGVMRWFEHEFADFERSEKARTGISSFDALNVIADKIAPGSDGLIFLPYMSGERSPIWDPKAKGIFYGIDFAKTKGHFVRACMEGVAYSLRDNLEVAERAGAEVEVLRAIGGSANSLLWTQIKADITGKKIVVPSSDTATTLGAVMLAGVGTGFYKSYEEAVQLTVKETRVHEPNPANKKVYDLGFKNYLEIYRSTSHINK